MINKDQRFKYYSKGLLISSVVMIGLFLTVFIIQSYFQTLQQSERFEIEKLSAIAKTLALQIDGELHQELVCSISSKDGIMKTEENNIYYNIHSLLKSVQQINQIHTPIYTLFKDDVCQNSENNNSSLLFGVSSSNPMFRHSWDSAPEIHSTHFETGGTIGEYYDDHGHWLSAFYPIKNRSGKAIALLQVDQSFCGFVKQARHSALQNSTYAFIFLFVLSAGFIYVYRMMLSSMSAINQRLNQMVTQRTLELQKTNQALKELNEKLENKVALRTNELKEMNLLLHQSNGKLKSFAHIASHDLKAPLRIINSFGQLLEQKYKNVLDDDGKEFIGFITKNAQKMSDLISGILSTSLMQHENKQAFLPVNLNEVLQEVLANLKEDITISKANVQYGFLPTIIGNKSDFVQLLQNLISNSIKYRHPERSPIIHIAYKQKGDQFHLEFQDNGIGISENALQTIFKEFNRGDAQDGQGHGIGLATCHRIIEEYNGSIQVKSEINQGTSFTCMLKNKVSTKVIEAEAMPI